jgi:hypothetical protein
MRIPRTGPMRPLVDRDGVAWLAPAVYDLLERFHQSTDCGARGRGTHRLECFVLCRRFGFADWTAWRAYVVGVRENGERG